MANKRPLFFLILVLVVIIIVAALFASNLIRFPSSSPSPGPSATPSLSPSVSPSASPTISPTSSSAANVTTVIMKDNYYVPANLTIDAGTTVTWINQGKDIHTATSYAPGPGGTGFLWNSGILQPGQSYSYTFNNPGTYNYYCGVHPTTMFGQVIVIAKT